MTWFGYILGDIFCDPCIGRIYIILAKSIREYIRYSFHGIFFKRHGPSKIGVYLYELFETHSQTWEQLPPSGPQICGRCWQVVVVQMYLYVIKIEKGTTKWWSLETSGRYLEVVFNSGLTVFHCQGDLGVYKHS